MAGGSELTMGSALHLVVRECDDGRHEHLVDVARQDVVRVDDERRVDPHLAAQRK